MDSYVKDSVEVRRTFPTLLKLDPLGSTVGHPPECQNDRLPLCYWSLSKRYCSSSSFKVQ